jgi:hypothetical protein
MRLELHFACAGTWSSRRAFSGLHDIERPGTEAVIHGLVQYSIG